MRDDLLDAKVAIDWAIAQLPTLDGRIKAWEDSTPYRVVEELHPENGQKLFKLADVKPLPPMINAEVGAIINSIRSSLDIATTSVAKRHNFTDETQTCFPFADSRNQFLGGGYKGDKLIKTLPPRERSIIENLEPWRGGKHPMLVALHRLDIMRKHRRLLNVRMDPEVIASTSWAYEQGLRFPAVWPGLKDDAVIGWAPIHATNCEFYFPLAVAFDEAGAASGKPVISTINHFARLADHIIELFDVP